MLYSTKPNIALRHWKSFSDRSARLLSPHQIQTSLTPNFYLSKSACWGKMSSEYFLRARLALCVDPTGLASSLVPAFLDETLHLFRLLRGAPACDAESECAMRRMIIILSVLSRTDNAIALAQAKHCAITQQLWQESCCVVTPNSGQSIQTLHQVTDSSKNECGSAAVPLDSKHLVSELYRGPQSLSIEATSTRLDNRDRRCRIRPQLFRGGCG